MTSKKKKRDYKKAVKYFSQNYWAVSTLVLAVLLIATLVSGGISGAVVSADEAGQLMLDFANKQGAEAELVSSIDNKQFYEVVLSIQGREVPLYVTKDGKSFTQQLLPLEVTEAPATPSEPTPTDVPKSDNPTAELFIMTHCPYGTMAEKGFLPIMRLLEDKADLSVKFVHYFMHDPEEAETPIQACIREEFADKYDEYLECFLTGDGNEDASGYIKNGNDPATCMASSGIDKAAVDECVSSGRGDEYYKEDSALSQGYGVKGSPTLVVNGQIVQSGRSPQAYLDAVCAAFNNAPEECNTEVSSATPIEFFGWKDKSGQPSSSVCG